MKTINVKVIPNAKKAKIVEITGGLKIYVLAPAVDGKANKALVEILAGYFSVRKSSVKIIRGDISRNKVIEIH